MSSKGFFFSFCGCVRTSQHIAQHIPKWRKIYHGKGELGYVPTGGKTRGNSCLPTSSQKRSFLYFFLQPAIKNVCQRDRSVGLQSCGPRRSPDHESRGKAGNHSTLVQASSPQVNGELEDDRGGFAGKKVGCGKVPPIFSRFPQRHAIAPSGGARTALARGRRRRPSVLRPPSARRGDRRRREKWEGQERRRGKWGSIGVGGDSEKENSKGSVYIRKKEL